MVTDVLGVILQDLGAALNIPGLHPDEHNTCLIRLNEVHVQIEMDQKSQQALILGVDLGEIPPGKYRENIFKQALKANGQIPSSAGIFGYSTQKDHLILFEMVDLKEAKGTKLAQTVTELIEKSQIWIEAIRSGNLPILSTASSSKGPAGLFGLL
jgi:hypothetical protein